MAKSKHLNVDGEPKANLHYKYSTIYREDGHKYISGNKDRKARYANNKTIRGWLKEEMKKGHFETVDKPGSDTHANNYHFDYGYNFVYGGGPYKNNAHHLLPKEFWDKLSSDEMSILQQLDYDIDNGENIIFLPYDSKGYPVHKLPIHNSNHRTYSKRVIRNAETIKNDLKRAAEKKINCEKTDLPSSIVNELMDFQKSYWRIIAKSTEGNVNDVFKVFAQKSAV